MSEYLKKLLGYNKRNMTSRVTEKRIKEARNKLEAHIKKPSDEPVDRIKPARIEVLDDASCSSASMVSWWNPRTRGREDYDFINSSASF